MLIKQAIKILITEDPGIVALVSTRIYPLVVPQKGPFPLIAWGRINRDVQYNLSAASQSTQLLTDHFEFISVAQGPGGDAVAEDIDDAVFERLSGFAGEVFEASAPTDIMTIQGIFHEKLSELYRDDLQQYATRSIYRVHFVRQQRP